MHTVFVYGTLKRGHRNHRLLEDSWFVGTGSTVAKFDMINSGFPVLLPNDDGLCVIGEVFKVDDKTLENLDRLEGEGRMYNRKIEKVNLIDGPVDCAIYIGNPEFWADHGESDQRYIVNGGNYYEWKPTSKMYRVLVSIDVEASNADDAAQEAMNEVMNDSMIVESVTELEA